MGGDDGCHFGRKRTSWIRADTFTCAGDSGPWATSEGTVHAGATGTEVETGAKTGEAAAQRRQAPGPEARRWRLGTGTGSWTRRDCAGGRGFRGRRRGRGFRGLRGGRGFRGQHCPDPHRDGDQSGANSEDFRPHTEHLKAKRHQCSVGCRGGQALGRLGTGWRAGAST